MTLPHWLVVKLWPSKPFNTLSNMLLSQKIDNFLQFQEASYLNLAAGKGDLVFSPRNNKIPCLPLVKSWLIPDHKN